ncbi:MAG: OmpA family protein [Deltaproteobacteria bacterium]|nr:OmpA family protein [Deltaproteobacteria bacterium]
MTNIVKRLCGILIASLFIITTAQAEMESGHFSITPMVGKYIFEGIQDIKDSPIYGLGLGYDLTDRWTAEAVFNFVDAEFEQPDFDIDVWVYRFDLLYHFYDSNRWVPYVAAGLGGINIDPDVGKSEDEFAVNWGGGLKYMLNESLALRGDIRHLLLFADDHPSNLSATVGLTYRFGAKKAAAKPLAPADSDGDGVLDPDDRCPDTPAGVPVDSNGCPKDSDGDGVYDYMDKCPDTPKGVPVDKDGCPKDSDGDGVLDHLDDCPDTPRGVPVDAKGCPKDSDGDGVFDYLDDCPDTPKAATVNERGCWVVEGLFFEIDKSDIKSETYPGLDALVNVLNNNPDMKLEIEGHTDNTGTAAYNQKLSERRAKSVQSYLVEKGIQLERLQNIGYGLTKPAASNDTVEGRAANRRTELNPLK